jgi:hypothetical protein
MDLGAVYYAKADGASIEEVVQPMMTPNGIGLSPDGRRLYVAETRAGRLWAWDIEGPGRLGRQPFPSPWGGTLLHQMPSYRLFDSLAVDSAALPLGLRFGFYGKHQVGVALRDGALWVANPLAAQGARPIMITEAELKAAAWGLLPDYYAVRAVIFPVAPRPATYSVSFPGPAFWVYRITSGVITGRTAKKFATATSAPCTAPAPYRWPTRNTTKTLVRMTRGVLAGQYVEVPQGGAKLVER